MNDEPLILWFDQIDLSHLPLVGGKNSSLGAMYRDLRPRGINLANGFAVTTAGYRHFLQANDLLAKINHIVAELNSADLLSLQKTGNEIRHLILTATVPPDLATAITNAYADLSNAYQMAETDTAVRSSATAEDLPGASFAGQQETYLNVRGAVNVVEAVKKCFASLFTDRAISYRVDKGFGQEAVALSVAVQKMVRSDLGVSGVAFSLDPETGFDKVVVANGIYGLGELIVQGQVIPDEFVVFKPTLAEGYRSILSKTLGAKDKRMIYSASGTKILPVTKKERASFCLTDDEILTLARWVVEIEKYFSARRQTYQPMDIEWAKDGESGQLFIVQARPETVHAAADKNVAVEYRLNQDGAVLVKGAAVGTAIGSGLVRVIRAARHLGEFKAGEVLVTEITDPDWEPIMKIAAAIVTDKGGRTSHAAIVSRELGVPCIVGTGQATRVLRTGQPVTIDCSSGKDGLIYDGLLKFERLNHRLDQIPSTRTKIMLNIGSPEEAFKNYHLPVTGVGLGRLEFIISSYIKIHPRALLDYVKLKKDHSRAARSLTRQINRLTQEHEDKTEHYINELTEGIAKIAAAFWPQPAIIRFSDFKSNEYRQLIGGLGYEPNEENPMLGWRGASRYYHPDFASAFALECQALKRARDILGLKNIVPMVPFCRTVGEGEKVLKIMAEQGLDRATDLGLKVYMMCEIPSNIIQAEQFLDLFDGFSIGSNDLTQLVLGLDRDSSLVAPVANENHPAVRELVAQAIEHCRARGKYIGICGQAPSDYPEFTKFLIERGIESISLNPDVVLKTIVAVAALEQSLLSE